MVVKYVKQEEIQETREYSIEIDDEYLRGITEEIKSRAVNPDEVPDITFDILHAAVYYDDNSLDKTIMIKGFYGNSYEDTLLGLVKDIIDDAVWDTTYSVVDSECFDSFDSIE